MKKAIILYMMFSFITVDHLIAQYNICDWLNLNSRIRDKYIDINKKRMDDCLDKGRFVSIREQVFAKHTYSYDSNYYDSNYKKSFACYIPNTNIFPEFQTKINGKWTPYIVNPDTVKKLMIDINYNRWYGYYIVPANNNNVVEITECIDSLEYYILEDLNLYTHVTQLAVLFEVYDNVPVDYSFIEKIIEKIIDFKELDTVFIAIEFDKIEKIEYFVNKILQVLPKDKINQLYIRGNFSNNKPKTKAKMNIKFPSKFPELKDLVLFGWTYSGNGIEKIILDSSVFANAPKLNTIEIGSEAEIKFSKNKQYPNIDSVFGYFSSNNIIEILKHCPNIKFLTNVNYEIFKYPQILISNSKLNAHCNLEIGNINNKYCDEPYIIKGNIPDSIIKNIYIRNLKFIKSKNKFIPKSISNLINLEYLIFEKCPKLVNLSNLENTNVRKLRLYKVRLDKLIPTLASVKNLDTLQLNFEEFMKLKDKDIIALEVIKQIQYIHLGYVRKEVEQEYKSRLKQIKNILVTKTITYKTF